jgi:hypothetical protein
LAMCSADSGGSGIRRYLDFGASLTDQAWRATAKGSRLCEPGALGNLPGRRPFPAAGKPLKPGADENQSADAARAPSAADKNRFAGEVESSGAGVPRFVIGVPNSGGKVLNPGAVPRNPRHRSQKVPAEALNLDAEARNSGGGVKRVEAEVPKWEGGASEGRGGTSEAPHQPMEAARNEVFEWL